MQRSLKFVKYLPGFGWQPTVLTVCPEDAAYPDVDETLLDEVPDTLQVAHTRAWDPYALYAGLLGQKKQETVGVGFLGEAEQNRRQKLARWVRANVFLPDARVGWVPFALRQAKALLNTEAYGAILTTGPPHSSHLIGRALARKYRLPWLVDLRDPWTDIDYYDELPMARLARRQDAALERSVLAEASAVTVVSTAMQQRLATRIQSSCEVILNGFDPADFEGKTAVQTDHFVLAYIGNLNEARNPVALWKALHALDAVQSMPRLRVRLVGNVDPVVIKAAQDEGLEALIERHPYVPHPEAVAEMQGSALLLLLINRVPGAEGIMTGKLYEYLASGRPVLGIGPPQGDAAQVLKATAAGQMFDYEATEAIAASVQQHYAAWEAGTPASGAKEAALAPYSRLEQTRMLAALLDRMTLQQEGAV